VLKHKLTLHGVLGANRFRLLIHGLAPGRYAAIIQARATGESSKPVRLNFTIEKP
jgi:hypothetical protein